MEQGGALLCTTHMPSYPHATLACIAEKRNLPNQTHGLRGRNHNTGGKHVAGRHNPREKGRSASAQDGAGMCTTPMPQPLTCIAKKSHLHNRTHLLRRAKYDTGWKHAAGRHDPGRIGMSANAQDWAVQCTTPMPQTLTQPSHAPPTKALATTSSPPAAKEA